MTSAPRLSDEPHHDGSALYTRQGPYTLGESIQIRLRVPSASSADRVRIRTTPDGEPVMVEARRQPGEHADWWVAELVLHNPVTNYRFLLEGDSIGYAWITQAGCFGRDVSDATDYAVAIHLVPPAWLSDTVGYQIFLDRFARGDTSTDTPEWAVAATWDEPLAEHPDVGTRQWYGGDLAGVEAHLDHLERVGVSLIYLTPFFPSGSSHRYDAASFDEVDPALGGDVALSALIRSAHQRGIRIIGDITLNHTGDRHRWFRTAQLDRRSPEAGFYLFDDPAAGDATAANGVDYVAWHGVASLPKLDHRSDELAARLYRGEHSVIAKYLDEPFGLDGWRVDCANTTGRWADVDRTHAVAAATLATTTSRRPDAWLLAEHCFDAGADLHGGGWHGVMAYQWFTRPLWSWLRGERPFTMMSQIELPVLDGSDTVASIRELGATVSWTARSASMTMLDSHDSARFRTAVGDDPVRHVVGLAALMTMPGVPTLFAGSEVGVRGDSMDSCRVPFPWDETTWDHETFAATAQLVRVRSESTALRHGSLRWIAASADSITYVRETADDTIVIHLNRTDTGDLTLTSSDLEIGAGAITVFGADARHDGRTLTLPGGAGATIARIEEKLSVGR